MNAKTTTKPAKAEVSEEVQAGSREVATRTETPVATTAEQSNWNPMAMMAMVRELALDERIDGGKLETIMRVANDQQDRAREIEFYQDKNRAVREMPLIRKDGRIVILDKNHPENMDLARTQGHFEKWPDVQSAITPVLDRNHLTLTHKIDHADGQTVVIAVLTHDNGYREESGPMRLPLDTSGGKNNVQGAGSSQTYGMRYTARAICGLRLVGGQQDDDGNLTALRDEPLNDQQLKRLEEAENAAARGAEAYEEWFHSIPAIDRRWMIETGRHAELGGKPALPGAEKPAAKPAGKGKPETNGNGTDVRTPEGWVATYEGHCANCPSLDALAELQDKAKRTMDRLKREGHTALHDRAVKAGSDAYTRLSGADDGDQAGDDLFGEEEQD